MQENYIKTVCKELNISQKDLAEKIGASEGTIRNWNSQNTVPEWAQKSIELLRENHKQKEIIQNFKSAIQGVLES